MTFSIHRIILPTWLALAGLGSVNLAQTNQVRDVFEERLQLWRSWRNDHRFWSCCSNTQEYRDIVALGPQIVPLLIEKMETNPEDFLLADFVSVITKKIFERAEWPGGKIGAQRVRMYVHWWKEDRFRTQERLAELSSKWISLKAEEKTEEAQEAYHQIVYLGIAALPYLVDMVEHQPELIPAISKLTGGALSPTATAADCRQWWGKNKQEFELPSQ